MRAPILGLSLAALLPSPAAAQQPSDQCVARDLSAVAGWNGIWISEHQQADINGRWVPGIPPPAQVLTLAGFEAPWNDGGWRHFEDAARVAMAGNTKQAGWGFPTMMQSVSPFKIVVSPAETVITNQYREVRYVPTDGRPRAPEEERWPTIWGDSIGCWEGDTLVIRTAGVKYTPEFNAAAPPLSEQAIFVERLRLVSNDRIEGEMTITDPARLEGTWTVRLAYVRHPVLTRLVHEGEIFANDRVILDGSGFTIAPPPPAATVAVDERQEVRLSAEQMDRVAGTYAADGAPIELVVERRGDRLFAMFSPIEPAFLPIRAEDPMTFFYRVHDGVLRFTADEAGRAIGFEATAGGQRLTGKRKG